MTQEKLFTLQEIADYLRVSRQTCYNWIWSKRLKASKIGKEYRVTEDDLQEFIKSGQNR